MAKVKIEWIEKKNEDWKVAALNENGTMHQEVSINRKSKSGEEFPNFDNLQAGQEVEGELWKSGAGKEYLFPPKKEAPRRSPAGITKAMETKAQNIEKAQDNKERGIMTSSSIRMATDIVLALLQRETILDEGAIKGEIKRWRNWFIAEWDNIDSAPPFN